MLIYIKKMATLATKSKLKAKQDKIVKLPAFDSIYFWSKIRFEEDGTENYLLIKPMYRYSYYIW